MGFENSWGPAALGVWPMSEAGVLRFSQVQRTKQ